MNSFLVIAGSLTAGFGLGILFFAGLWMTVRKGVTARHPAVWFIISLILRISIVIAGLFLTSGQEWPRLLLGLSGFILARLLLTRMISRQVKIPVESTGGDPNDLEL